MIYYPEPDSHIRDKGKVAFNLSIYSTKKELDHVTDVDTSDLAADKDFVALKTEIDILTINKRVNISTNLNNFETKVDDLNVGKLKAVPVDLNKLSDVADSEFVKNTKH